MSMNVAGRVSSRMQTENLLNMLRRGQLDLQRAQMQISTGQKILSTGDDPVSAGRAMDLTRLLARLDQFNSNVAGASGVYAAADTALGEAADLLREANALASSSANAGISEAERAGNLHMLDSIIAQMQRIANRTYQGRHLFDGQAGTGQPFIDFAGGTLYAGGTDPFSVALESGWTQQTALDGGTVFAARSEHVGATVDLNPRLDRNALLADLNGARGQGISLGAILVSDGVNPPVMIDLSVASSIGDIVDIFNAHAPPNMTMGSTSQGLRVTTSQPGGKVRIEEVGNGTIAADLGILAAGTLPFVLDKDLDARITQTTRLDFLLNGSGIQASSITFSNGGKTATINTSLLGTVRDLVVAVEQANIGARVVVSEDGRSLHLLNILSGSQLKVTQSGGQAAAQLGWRTLHVNTALDTLNDGAGVGIAGDGLADLQINQRSGATFNVSLAGCRTIGQVIAAINTAPGNSGSLVASLSAVGGIRLLDSSVPNGTSLQVIAVNGSTAAGDLGLLQTAPADQLIGTDTSGVATGSVFDHLLGLRAAMAAGNIEQIGKQASNVEADLARLIEVRGLVGAQARQAEAQAGRLDDQRLDATVLLSQVRDIDLTEAVLRFQQLQTQLSASMLTVGKMLDMSLLDYIR